MLDIHAAADLRSWYKYLCSVLCNSKLRIVLVNDPFLSGARPFKPGKRYECMM